jgi:hypothetical protein
MLIHDTAMEVDLLLACKFVPAPTLPDDRLSLTKPIIGAGQKTD